MDNFVNKELAGWIAHKTEFLYVQLETTNKWYFPEVSTGTSII